MTIKNELTRVVRETIIEKIQRLLLKKMFFFSNAHKQSFFEIDTQNQIIRDIEKLFLKHDIVNSNSKIQITHDISRAFVVDFDEKKIFVRFYNVLTFLKHYLHQSL